MERRATASPIKTSDPGRVRGYAASFGRPATIKDMMGREFSEVIHRDAFARTLKERPDIRLLRDHQPSLLLGRTKSGTLAVGTDDHGLWFECQLPLSPEGDSVREAIRRGDLDACSFGFTVQEDSWGERDGMPTRELRDVTLFECSIVAFPAYEDGTSVDLRSLDLHRDEKKVRERRTATVRAKLRLAKLLSNPLDSVTAKGAK